MSTGGGEANLTAPAAQDEGAEKRLFFFIYQALSRVHVRCAK